MIGWFLSIDKAAQVALASAVISGVVVGIIAVLGFWITFKTSTAANERIARISTGNSLYQMKFAANYKIAEMRQVWIDDLRRHIAEFCDETFKVMILARQKKDHAHLKIQFLRSYILLKLNIHEENHKKLISCMHSVMNVVNEFVAYQVDAKSDATKQSEYAKAIDDLYDAADVILKTEWSRVKEELQSATEEFKANLAK